MNQYIFSLELSLDLSIYLSKGHSINTMNFAYKISSRKHRLRLHILQGNQYWWAISFLRWLSASSLHTTTPGSSSLPESQSVSTQCTIFSSQVRSSKHIFSSFMAFSLKLKHVSQCSFFRIRGSWYKSHHLRKWRQRTEVKSCTSAFTLHWALISLGKVCSLLFSLQQWVNSRVDYAF